MKLPGDENNPVGEIIQISKSLFKKRDSKSTYIILSKLKSIFSSKAVGEVFNHFCKHGAATAWILREELDISEATAHRAIQRLNSIGFIDSALKANGVNRSMGGARSTVWALEGTSPDEVTEAIRLHYQILSSQPEYEDLCPNYLPRPLADVKICRMEKCQYYKREYGDSPEACKWKGWKKMEDKNK